MSVPPAGGRLLLDSAWRRFRPGGQVYTKRTPEPLFTDPGPANHRKFLINTASVGSVPREKAKRPLRDQSNQKIWPES